MAARAAALNQAKELSMEQPIRDDTTAKRPEEPFFQRYLEKDFPAVKTDVKAGASNKVFDDPHTMKYPSDGDDQLPKI
jgi:hypothetical protein